MPLTDTAIRKAKPGAKVRRLYDEKGLYLEISPSGGKWWRQKYRFGGKEKRLSLGTYPDVTLRMAREGRDEARQQVATGLDPSAERRVRKAATQQQAANSFGVVARSWYATNRAAWAESHGKRIFRRLEKHVFPYLGGAPIHSITAPQLLSVIKRISDTGTHETAHRTLQVCGRVFRYAIQSGITDNDPTPSLKGALTPAKGCHFAAVTEPDDLAPILRAIENYQGGHVTPVVHSALKLTPMLFVRPGELRQAKWADIDLQTAEWRFDVSKTGNKHIVPLPRQAVAILRELRMLTGRGCCVFPNPRSPKGDRPMSENAVNAALRSLGINGHTQTAHGFRATARTMLDEVLEFRPEIIEHQLAHMVRDPLGRAYNRTQHLAERREMMQKWADYLDDLKLK